MTTNVATVMELPGTGDDDATALSASGVISAPRSRRARPASGNESAWPRRSASHRRTP